MGASEITGTQVRTEKMVSIDDVFATVYKTSGIDWETRIQVNTEFGDTEGVRVVVAELDTPDLIRKVRELYQGSLSGPTGGAQEARYPSGFINPPRLNLA